MFVAVTTAAFILAGRCVTINAEPIAPVQVAAAVAAATGTGEIPASPATAVDTLLVDSPDVSGNSIVASRSTLLATAATTPAAETATIVAAQSSAAEDCDDDRQKVSTTR